MSLFVTYYLIDVNKFRRYASLHCAILSYYLYLLTIIKRILSKVYFVFVWRNPDLFKNGLEGIPAKS